MSTSLNIIELLVNRIKRPFLLIIPSAAFTLKDEHLKRLIDERVLDQMLLVDMTGHGTPLENEAEIMSIINKKQLLQENTLKLLKLKSDLDQTSFNYLKNIYFKNLNEWVSVARNFKESSKVYSQDFKPFYQHYLDLQFNTLLSHKFELMSTIGIVNLNPTINSTNQLLIEELNNDTLLSDKKEISLLKPNKKKLPSIEEIDNYLLTQVFNVEIN